MNPVDTLDQTKIATKAVTIIGMSNDGCLSLTARALNSVQKAQVLVGGKRHLAYFPQFEGQRIPIKGKLLDLIEKIDELSHENNVVVLASGDPLFFGVGGLITKKIGSQRVEIIAHPGSIQLAFSRIGMKWDDAKIISLHGKKIEGFITKIQSADKIALLTDNINTPQKIAIHMLKYKEENWDAYVCENLGGVDEKVQQYTLSVLSQEDQLSDLNVLILNRSDISRRTPSTIGFIHEDDFEKRMPKKGLITKREVRLLSLGYLNLNKNSIVWDIGAASGSVAIEAARIAENGFVYAVEINSGCIEICKDNLITHKIDNVQVIEGRAPEALEGLPKPDAVFVGGSKGSMRDILDYCLEKLTEGGKLVINAITMENIQEAYSYAKENKLDVEISQVNISRGVPLAHYHRYEALNPIHIFAITKLVPAKLPNDSSRSNISTSELRENQCCEVKHVKNLTKQTENFGAKQKGNN